MPFHELPPAVATSGLEMAFASYPFLGETVNGDGLFVETGRAVDAGVSEAGVKGGLAQFQHVGLAACLANRPAGSTPAEIVTELVAALQLYVGPSWPDDDTTAVCMRRN